MKKHSTLINSPIQNRRNSKNSLLWKVDSPQLKKPSYIFGTIHLICEKDFEIKEKVRKAFNSCSKLMIELDLSSADEMDQLSGLSSNQSKISEQLNAKERIELDEILNTQYQLSLEQVDNLAPIMIINLMINKAIECETQKVYELEFIEMARAADMNIGGLESADEQMNIANEIYIPGEIIRQLRKGDSYKDLFTKMVDAYKNEDLVTLSKLVNDRRFLSLEAMDKLVADRNQHWVNIMPEMIMNESVFFAVGAGHLPGKEGILHLLKNGGYSVVPVFQ